MNLLLLDAHEVAADGEAHIQGARALHLHQVLRAQPGARVRVGVLDGPVGEAEVLACDRDSARLRCQLDQAPPPPGEDTLLLAIPRPLVLGRCLEHAAALGFGCIVLFRCWRVEPGHLTARSLRDEHVDAALRKGLAQARRTHRPRLHRFLRFKPFVEDELDALVPPENRFVAHPDASMAVAAATPGAAPLSLALGPEGGLMPYEVDLLEQRGFTAVSAGPLPQRVEVAVPLLFGQLALLRATRPH